ncbi:MAG: GNAT family N-acetyltransferase [Acidimicrobiales bacterium]
MAATSCPSADIWSGRPPRLVLRADTRIGAGAGHLVRCAALAEAWTGAGGRSTIVVDQGGADFDALLASLPGVEVTSLTEDGTGRSLAAVAAGLEADWVAVDGYRFGHDQQAVVRSSGARVLVIDDHAGHGRYCADLVLDQNLDTDVSAYGEVDLLPGPRHALIRSTFARYRSRRSAGWERRVVLTFGASPTAAARGLVERLAASGMPARLDVLGEGFGHLGSETTTVHGLVDDPSPIFAAADVVVAAAGSTAWELCCVGAPAVLVAMIDNQVPVGEAIGSAGAGRFLGDLDSLDPATVVDEIVGLLADHSGREEMSRAGTELVDGRGADRVVAQLLGSMLALRPVTPDDAALLYEWAGDAAVRSASFSTDPIAWGEHVTWLSGQLAADDAWLYLATIADTPVGLFRGNAVDEAGVVEVGVSLAATMRGRGLAGPLVARGSQRLEADAGAAVLRAQVRRSNPASWRAFLRAGFVQRGRRSHDGAEILVFERRAS